MVKVSNKINNSTFFFLKSLFDMDHPYTIPSRELYNISHQTGKVKSSSQKCWLGEDMIVPRRVYIICAAVQTLIISV